MRTDSKNPCPKQLDRLHRQLAADIISAAEFAESVTYECVLMAPEVMTEYCDSIDTVLVAGIRSHVSRRLAESGGLPHPFGFIPLRATEEEIAETARWLAARYRLLLEVTQRFGQ